VAPNKNVNDQSINLKIYSPHVLNLTLVDLPGITKVPVGDQPQDIEKRIRKLVLSFIEKPRCLILAVSAATSDLSTSDAIQLAKQVDPAGLRTLGVLTKIDLMDQGTNALDMLSSKIIPLQLGYIGVVNRSQKDINSRKSIQEALKAEELFFKTHAAYRSIAHICGIPYLSKKLNQILINHIKRCLPDLRVQINSHINELQNELTNYGPTLTIDHNNKGALLLHLISKFSENFQNSIDGNGVTVMNHMQQNTKKLVLFLESQLAVDTNSSEFVDLLEKVLPEDIVNLSNEELLLLIGIRCCRDNSSMSNLQVLQNLKNSPITQDQYDDLLRISGIDEYEEGYIQQKKCSMDLFNGFQDNINQ